jgi:hypothetical protein
VSRSGLARLALGAFLATLPGCRSAPPTELVKSAKFGVFFGGQIQERRELPFELDPAKQTQGFRVEFSEPLAADTAVEFRIDTPSPSRSGKKKPARGDTAAPEPSAPLQAATEIARAGETRFDHVTSFHPGDPLGLWNVRVVVRGKVVIDRAVEVYDPAARERLTPTDGGI